MTPERWQDIERLYHEALEREADARPAFLEKACAGDEALGHEVNALLAANQNAEGFLDEHALAVEAKVMAAEQIPTLILPPAIQHFSHYQILSKIGVGGMGEVYLARDTMLERRVAIKVLPSQFTTDTGRLQRFTREAKTASSLNHPNILTIYEIGHVQADSGLIHFIATEYVEGITLRSRLAAGPMTLREALDVTIQIAAALDAAHRAGIVHRDIKPENLMLRPDGLVKVLDFGLAKLTVSQSQIEFEENLTSTAQGVVLGTPRYMSPEQARGKKVDGRSDVFSLGSVLHEMLTGQSPFQGESVADLFAAILEKEPPPLSLFVSGLPVKMQGIVNRTLAKDCAARYPSAGELQIDLQTLGQQLSAETLSLQRSATSLANNPLDEARTTSQSVKVVTSKLSNWTDSLASILTLSAPGQAISLARMLFATVILGVAGLVVWIFLRPANRSAVARELKFEMIYSKAGQDNVLLPDSHFSPDGETIAFAASGDGNNILVRQIGGDRDSQVTFGNWDDGFPLWSPNGRKIAFVSNRNNELGIWTTLSLGSTPVLIKTLGGRETISTRGTLKLLTWTKDESAIYYKWDRVLFRLNLNSKESVPVLSPNQPFQLPEDFAISPNEQQVAFVAQSKGQENRQYDLWRVELGSGTPHRMTNDPYLDQTPLWISDDKLLYNSSRNDRLQIFLADLSGGEPVLISTSDHQCRLTDYSAKSNRLLCYEQRDESNIFALQTETGEDRQITDDLGPEFWSTVSPDGQTLLYQVLQGDRLVWDPRRSLLFTKPTLVKGQAVRLVSNAFEAQWSPSGEQVGFLRLVGAVSQLWMIKSAGGEEKVLVTDNIIFGGQRNGPPYNRVHARAWNWSPDGNQIAYAAQLDGVGNVWTVDSNGAKKRQVSSNTDSTLRFDCPTWSPDGRLFAYLSEPARKPASGKQIASLWVGGQEQPVMIFQTESVLRLLGWLSNEQLIVALADRVGGSTSQPTTIRVFSIGIAPTNRQSAPTQIGSLTQSYLSSLRLSPSGRVVAFVKTEKDRTDLWLATLNHNRLAQERKLTSNSDPSFYFSSLAWSPDGKTIYYDKQTRWSLLTMVEGFNEK
jgi:serine/threonine protein kinase